MTPSTGKQFDPLEELKALETPRSTAKSAADTKKTTEKTAEKKPSNSGGSWWLFRSLFNKLAPKPKNQMILPDDSKLTIVWDPSTNKWINKDEDDDSSTATLAPPPKTADMSFRAPAVERVPQPSLPSAHNEDTPAADISKLRTDNNMFKLPKGRSMRANYVDVLNTGGKSKGNAVSSNVATPPMTSLLVPTATSSPQMLVPAPINDPTAPVDFLIPTATPPSGNIAENTPGPMMFNPSDMKDRSVKNMPPSRYHPR
ncbi:hypothetical protein ALC60_14241 [Trachymyrmex zeteki]|uniref:Uncharacterized protein n=1 Tax=Mycetomoellerius zeteki TaxID=64791 RepID=A0A151WFV7_9HYME|nr:hypothetical protein ALC60_14241 [Trachymyrmex zeteki]